jgi:hypothetical protein
MAFLWIAQVLKPAFGTFRTTVVAPNCSSTRPRRDLQQGESIADVRASHMRGLQNAIFMPFMFHAAMTAFLENPAEAARSWLFECSDAGPWACEEEGCPASSLDCSMLASLGVCPTAFGHVWQQPPQGLAAVLVQEPLRQQVRYGGGHRGLDPSAVESP